MKIFVNQNLNPPKKNQITKKKKHKKISNKNPNPLKTKPKKIKIKKNIMHILSFHFDTYTCDNTSALVLLQTCTCGL